MGSTDWTWDILNISLFFKGSRTEFPESKKGVTFFMNSSSFRNKTLNNVHSYLKIITRRLSKEALEVIGKEKYDVVVISAPELMFMIEDLRANFKAKLKVFVHDLGIDSYHPYSIFFRNSIKRTISVDEILVDSEKTRIDLEAFFKQNGIYINEGSVKTAWLTIDYKRYKKIDKQNARKILSLPEDIPIFLSVGSPSKNLKTVIMALNNIGLKDFIFLRIGKIPLELSGLMNENLRDKTRIAVNVGDEEMAYYYNAADLLLYPSVLEGFGLEILEAISCEVPVLIADLEPMISVAGKCALKIRDPFDHREISELLLKFVSSKDSFLRECDYALIKKKFNNEEFIQIVQE